MWQWSPKLDLIRSLNISDAISESIKAHMMANCVLCRVEIWYSPWNLALEQRVSHEIWRSDMYLEEGKRCMQSWHAFLHKALPAAWQVQCFTNTFFNVADGISWQSCLQQGWGVGMICRQSEMVRLLLLLLLVPRGERESGSQMAKCNFAMQTIFSPQTVCCNCGGAS